MRLRRAFGVGATADYDPFLLLDDFRTERPEDYLPGFPGHSHRGIETITYVLAGTVDHGDSMGNRGKQYPTRPSNRPHHPSLAAVPHAVAVVHRPGEHVRDCLDAAMGMPGKAGQIVLRPLVREVVEQQKRIIVCRGAEAERSPETHAGALERRFGLDPVASPADGHAVLLRSGPIGTIGARILGRSRMSRRGPRHSANP